MTSQAFMTGLRWDLASVYSPKGSQHVKDGGTISYRKDKGRSHREANEGLWPRGKVPTVLHLLEEVRNSITVDFPEGRVMRHVTSSI